jgi:uncharacterized caspase-like protein
MTLNADHQILPPITRLRFRSLVAIGLLLGPIGAAAIAGERYALVVGVNECPRFRLPDGSQPRPLKGAEIDADAVARTLIADFGFPKKNVRCLKNAMATYASVKRAFDELIACLKADDQFVFHFSGHGTQIPDQKPFDEPDGLDEALCPYDTESTGRNLLIDDELGLWLEKIPARRITVILDCCHAGSGTKEVDEEVVARYLPIAAIGARSGDSHKRPWHELQGTSKSLDRDLCAFFACQPDQQAFERRIASEGQAARRVGQFTHFLLEGLHGKKADADHNGIVSRREALDYARRRMDESFNRTRERRVDQQQPMLEAVDENAAALSWFR